MTFEEKVKEVCLNCLKENWDGAAPVSEGSRKLAVEFYNSLPNYFPEPEVAVDPDGEISLDWDVDPDHSLSISFSEIGKLSFAVKLRSGDYISGKIDINDADIIIAILNTIYS